MMRTHVATLFTLIVLAGCAVGSGAVVKGVEPGDLLKLRAAPGLDQPILIGLPNGTRLTRQDCGPVDGKLWCKVVLSDRPNVSGYVSADYLAVR